MLAPNIPSFSVISTGFVVSVVGFVVSATGFGASGADCFWQPIAKTQSANKIFFIIFED